MDPLDHLFRHEAGRMVAALTRRFGADHLALAEDVVQDALLRALETWKVHGVPDNPSAWLLRTAHHRAIDVLRRAKTARSFADASATETGGELPAPSDDELFGAEALRDSQLRMMFSCCDPRLAEEAQVALVLHILCGFRMGEIASAFLSGEETVKKRVTRAKALLSSSRHLFELSDRDFSERLSSVHRALYLLFNEGYHGASTQSAVRQELCEEAMRLTSLLTQHPLTATPATHALLALMCLHAARLPARVDAAGDFTLLLEQDRARWDAQLIGEGLRLLDLSAQGSELTAYHLEAAIASMHATAERAEDTPWEQVVSLYDLLMKVRPSPVAALSRALAIAQQDGPERGLQEVRSIADRDRLASYPYYACALGELELKRNHIETAHAHFLDALGLARNPSERRLIERRIAECQRRRAIARGEG
jgi:RNA polymerase sigma-70 factor (ECF subfamily)